MNTIKKVFLLIVLLVTYISSTAYSEQNDKWKLNLEFQKSEMEQDISEREYNSNGHPTFLAKLYFNYPKGGFSLGNSSELFSVIGCSYSLVPKEYRQTVASKIRSGTIGSFVRDTNEISCFHVYGYDEEEVRRNAQAIIDGLNYITYKKFKEAQNQLDEYSNEKTELEKMISQLEIEEKNTAPEFEKIKKVVKYQTVREAQESICEFNKTTQSVDIEIVGIQAKLDMIKQQEDKLQTSGACPEGTSDFLFQMRLTQEINLAGALAQKNASESGLKNATTFLTLIEKTTNIPQTLQQKQNRLSNVKSQISNLEQLLAEMRPVELVDNKITIYPLHIQTSNP
ncbi:MAG TPA: hypothetical protein PLP05_00085 [Sedimentisphaerales bacterium]|nr:hypothetical protein [Sedimentisphaerales bacterium]